MKPPGFLVLHSASIEFRTNCSFRNNEKNTNFYHIFQYLLFLSATMRSVVCEIEKEKKDRHFIFNFNKNPLSEIEYNARHIVFIMKQNWGHSIFSLTRKLISSSSKFFSAMNGNVSLNLFFFLLQFTIKYYVKSHAINKNFEKKIIGTHLQ